MKSVASRAAAEAETKKPSPAQAAAIATSVIGLLPFLAVVFVCLIAITALGLAADSDSGLDGSEPGDAAPGANSDAVSAEQFDEMFPGRIAFYSYNGLAAAIAEYPAFAATGDETTRRREVAAFLANVNHESGGLVFVEEINQAAWGNYCNPAAPYGCPAGRTAYHGRGPIQLSWNTNYYAAGNDIGADLLNNPDLVKNNSTIAWQTALWFWMTQQGAGTMTPHAAMTNGAGFGETIRSINGALECGGGNPATVQSRIDAYRRFAKILDVTPDTQVNC